MHLTRGLRTSSRGLVTKRYRDRLVNRSSYLPHVVLNIRTYMSGPNRPRSRIIRDLSEILRASCGSHCLCSVTLRSGLAHDTHICPMACLLNLGHRLRGVQAPSLLEKALPLTSAHGPIACLPSCRDFDRCPVRGGLRPLRGLYRRCSHVPRCGPRRRSLGARPGFFK